MRFSITSLLAATAFVAIVLWMVNGPIASESINRFFTTLCRFFAAVVLISSGASYLNRDSHPTYRAVLIALLFLVAFYSIEWIKMWVEYFRQTQIPPPPPPKGMIGWPPYFEDGMLIEAFIFPALGLVISAPIVALIASVVSRLTVTISKMITDRPWRFEASNNSDSSDKPQ